MNALERHLKEVVNPCWNYAGRIKDWEGHVTNAVLGLAGEAGEAADQIKKMLFHTEKEYEHHRDKLVLELGDVMFYYLKLMELTGIDLEEVLKGNRRKLQSRHPELGLVKERFPEGHVK